MAFRGTTNAWHGALHKSFEQGIRLLGLRPSLCHSLLVCPEPRFAFLQAQYLITSGAFRTQQDS